METNKITPEVIGCSMNIHSQLGPGLLESVYKECLYFKLKQAGLLVEKEKPIPLTFESVKLECGYRLDLLVENFLVVEIKSADSIHPLFQAQVLTYMRLGKYKLGLIINFNVLHLKDGIKRIIL
jgi:GxxExxY protein